MARPGWSDCEWYTKGTGSLLNYAAALRQLVERAAWLQTPVNRRLACALLAMDDICTGQIARLLTDIAADRATLTRTETGYCGTKHDIQNRALPGLRALYRWQDALAAKLP